MAASMVDPNNPSIAVTPSERALQAWKQMFSHRQVTLSTLDPTPFVAGQVLGSGGLGIVVQTSIGGIPVAWKRTYARKLTQWHLNEAEILSHLSERRHRHIVELIGSYIHRQKGIYELGLLLWPVAECDLAGFLQEIDALLQERSKPSLQVYFHDIPTISITTLTAILDIDLTANLEIEAHWERIYQAASRRLRKIFGCAAEALAYLHNHGIRHKDIKPSQILITRDGTWLTDFGWSRNFAEMTNSVTSGGDTITFKYHAPERANMKPCGRPEDVFSLGCTYLEMAYRLAEIKLDEHPLLCGHGMWSYQANLAQLDDWLAFLKSELTGGDESLPSLISQMLTQYPSERTTINEVLAILRNDCYGIEFFDKCCRLLPRTLRFEDYYNDQTQDPYGSDMSQNNQENIHLPFRSDKFKGQQSPPLPDTKRVPSQIANPPNVMNSSTALQALESYVDMSQVIIKKTGSTSHGDAGVLNPAMNATIYAQKDRHIELSSLEPTDYKGLTVKLLQCPFSVYNELCGFEPDCSLQDALDMRMVYEHMHMVHRYKDLVEINRRHPKLCELCDTYVYTQNEWEEEHSAGQCLEDVFKARGRMNAGDEWDLFYRTLFPGMTEIPSPWIIDDAEFAV